jgi:hypothetical protein
MSFPYLIDEETSECKFAKKTHTMTLTLPVTGVRDLDSELEAAAVAEAAVAAALDATKAPIIDWQHRLALTNTIMSRLCAE